MKRSSFILILFLFSSFSYGQFTQFAEGPVFTDPGNGFAKIILMKDYSTMFIHVSFEKGLFVHVYEPKNRARTESIIEPAYGTIKEGNVEGIFEVNGDAVVMVCKSDNNETVLYRLIIDGKTGKLKEEKQIASVKKQNTKQSVSLPQVSVRKDPNSDNYAVALFNNSTSDTTKRIEIILYGSDNQELNRGSYISKAEKHQYLQYVDMSIIGTDKVAMLVYGCDISSSNEKTGDLIFASLDKGSKNIAVNDLDYSNDQLLQNGIIRYDTKTKQVLLLTTATVKSESNKLNTYLGFIDPATKKLLTNANINAGEKFKSKYAELYGKKAAYAGIPQDLLLNNDGSYTIVFDELETVKEKDTSNTILRNTAVVTYNKEVEIVSAYLIPMDQHVSNVSLSAFYQSTRNNSGQYFLKINQYKSSAYISDGHNSFVLFNDKDDNISTASAGKLVQLKDMQNADGFYSLLTGNDIVPKRQYVFGKPVEVTGELEHNTGLFTVYDYDKSNNVLVTMRYEKNNGRPGIKLLWLQP